MSEVFEGVIIPATASDVQVVINSLAPPVPVRVFTLAPRVAAVVREGSRRDIRFTEEVNDFGRQLSSRLGEALVVRYDSRIGHRSSVYFQDAALIASYGPDDELYVPLDENGYPITTAAPIRVEQFEPGEEYETVQNAIELGLSKLKRSRVVWETLEKLIGSH